MVWPSGYSLGLPCQGSWVRIPVNMPSGMFAVTFTYFPYTTLFRSISVSYLIPLVLTLMHNLACFIMCFSLNLYSKVVLEFHSAADLTLFVIRFVLFYC